MRWLSSRPACRWAKGTPSPSRNSRHKSAFDGYVRKGETANLTALEQKALSVGIDADGGFLVPKETERAVNMALKTVSPIRSIAGVRQVSGSVYKVPFATTGAATGWVGEAAVRPQTNTPTLAELSFPTMELYAMPAATQAILDDSAVDIDAWLAEEVRVAFAQQEGTAFVTGDGVNKPKGFLTYPTVANASWTWGNLGFVTSGAAGAFPAANQADKLIDLVYAVKGTYRANGSFVMNELHQLDRVEVLDAAADALGRVEQHVRLGRIGIAQHANTHAIHDQVAAREITEGDREAVRRDVRHILGFDDRIAEQPRRLRRIGRGLPDIRAIGILHLAHGAERRTSTIGMLGMAPCWKPVSEISSRSVSNRTGTSNSKPAVTAAPAAGRCPGRNVTTPVAVSTVNCVSAIFSMPATATRTVPDTGFLISRVQGANAEPYVLTS